MADSSSSSDSLELQNNFHGVYGEARIWWSLGNWHGHEGWSKWSQLEPSHYCWAFKKTQSETVHSQMTIIIYVTGGCWVFCFCYASIHKIWDVLPPCGCFESILVKGWMWYLYLFKHKDLNWSKKNNTDQPQLSVVGTHDDRRDLHIVFCK